jgi:uncharacterized membrane protein
VADSSSSALRTASWVPLTSLALCLVGLALGGYLTYEHYTASATLSCPDTGAINCLKVTTSPYSEVLGVPVALLGLLYYAGMTALCSPPAWRSSDSRVPVLRLAGAGLGVVFVLYLIWVELFAVNAICLWCTAVHLVTLLLFGLLVFAYALAPRPASSERTAVR